MYPGTIEQQVLDEVLSDIIDPDVSEDGCFWWGEPTENYEYGPL